MLDDSNTKEVAEIEGCNKGIVETNSGIAAAALAGQDDAATKLALERFEPVRQDLKEATDKLSESVRKDLVEANAFCGPTPFKLHSFLYITRYGPQCAHDACCGCFCFSQEHRPSDPKSNGFTMQEVAGGRLDVEVPFREKGDEVGDMARALEGLSRESQRNGCVCVLLVLKRSKGGSTAQGRYEPSCR